MANMILELQKYSVILDNRKLVNEIDIEIGSAEIHLLIGANGSGKSTLLKSIMFDKYESEGSITYFGEDLNKLSTTVRARKGIFLAHQEPTEIPGVPILDFLRLSYNEIHREEPLDPWTFKEFFDVFADMVGLSDEYAYRNLNEDFSGGEKKKLELLQLLILKPKLALIDELDSGLDYKSLETMFSTLSQYKDKNKTSMIIVSHNKNILDYIKPDKVHMIEEGEIIKSGAAKILE